MDELETYIRRAQTGDPQAFDAVVRYFRNSALRYAYAKLGDRDLADDAVQESFIQAYAHLPALREPAAFAVWFRIIVSRCCTRVLRRNLPAVVSLDDVSDTPSAAGDPFDAVSEQELVRRVHDAIAGLPEHERSVTQLFCMDGYSYKEVAEMLKIPVTTVTNRLHSSRARLRAEVLGATEKPKKERIMALTYETTTRKMLKGESTITIRVMTKDDIPVMRRLDDEITAGLDLANASRAPGNESGLGGPWAEDEALLLHFRMYEEAGNITLLAFEESGKLVGFADLWTAREPEPFGDSLNVECIDYIWEYYHLGFETVMLQEAEKVAAGANLPALDIGTNTSSGDYPSLRRFGMSVFYEYDQVWCDCGSLKTIPRPEYRMLPYDAFDTSGLLRISHWCPTDFGFKPDPGRPGVYEFHVDGERVVADFGRLYGMGLEKGADCELFGPAKAISSPALLNRILRATAILASEDGADEIPLPCPCSIPIDESLIPMTRREFRFAWMRNVVGDRR